VKYIPSHFHPPPRKVRCRTRLVRKSRKVLCQFALCFIQLYSPLQKFWYFVNVMQMVEFQKSHYITAKTFTGLDCIYEKHGECLRRSRNCLLFASTWVQTRVFIANLLSVLVLSYYLPLRSELWCFQISTYKRCLVSSLPPVVCRRTQCLIYIFVLICA
jgi:hypothetical protein